MPTTHGVRATLFGLAGHPGLYERHARWLAGRLYRRVTSDVAAAALPAHARVLDIGTGPGVLPLQIAAARADLRIDAVDLASKMIDRARSRAAAAGYAERVTFLVADVARLPYPDASFDLVVSTLSQHHWNDPGAAMHEVCRILRPGAQAWIYDFRWVLPRAQHAARSLTPSPVLDRQSPLIGTSRLQPIGRVMIRPTAGPT
jgi:ubiquinone/menaquinone biosynthesis C-methylase UbiE